MTQPEHPQDHQPQQPPYGGDPGDPTPPYGPPTPLPPPAAPQYPGAQPHAYQSVPMTPADQRTWAIASHLSPFLAFFVGVSFLGPLIIYVVLKNRGDFIRHHSAEALNFQLTMWIGLLISVPLLFVGIGFLTAGAILIAMVVCHILGAVAASNGQDYRYPFTIRFVS